MTDTIHEREPAPRGAHRARLAAERRWPSGAGATAASRPEDARLWRAVRQALLRCGYRAIDVSVADGLITLEGSVADIPTRVLAEDCCLRLAEVREVRNRLRVAPAATRQRAPRA